MLIKKWRVLTMLGNIKNWINTDRNKEDLIKIIDNYISFVSGMEEPEGN